MKQEGGVKKEKVGEGRRNTIRNESLKKEEEKKEYEEVKE